MKNKSHILAAVIFVVSSSPVWCADTTKTDGGAGPGTSGEVSSRGGAGGGGKSPSFEVPDPVGKHMEENLANQAKKADPLNYPQPTPHPNPSGGGTHCPAGRTCSGSAQ